MLTGEYVEPSQAGGPCRELTTNWDPAEGLAVAPPPTGSGCRPVAPVARRNQRDPAVLKGHGAARKRFWGALSSRKRSRRVGQRHAGRTPQSCLVPPLRVRPTWNVSGADAATRSSVFASSAEDGEKSVPVEGTWLDFRGHRTVRPGEIRVSATAAKVDPHLLVPGAGAALLGSLDAAGDEVWSAVAVPVRHANAGGLLAIVVGDEQL